MRFFIAVAALTGVVGAATITPRAPKLAPVPRELMAKSRRDISSFTGVPGLESRAIQVANSDFYECASTVSSLLALLRTHLLPCTYSRYHLDRDPPPPISLSPLFRQTDQPLLLPSPAPFRRPLPPRPRTARSSSAPSRAVPTTSSLSARAPASPLATAPASATFALCARTTSAPRQSSSATSSQTPRTCASTTAPRAPSSAKRCPSGRPASSRPRPVACPTTATCATRSEPLNKET